MPLSPGKPRIYLGKVASCNPRLISLSKEWTNVLACYSFSPRKPNEMRLVRVWLNNETDCFGEFFGNSLISHNHFLKFHEIGKKVRQKTWKT